MNTSTLSSGRGKYEAYTYSTTVAFDLQRPITGFFELLSLGIDVKKEVSCQNNNSKRDIIRTVASSETALFEALATRWKKQTAAYSSIDKKTAHLDYQKIIAMGPEVIILILLDLQREPNHWFAALKTLSGGENPVALEHRGNVLEMSKDWLRWGKIKKLID